MNTSSNIKPETVYDVRFTYTSEYLKESFFKELLEKYLNQIHEKVKMDANVLNNSKLVELKILEAPDIDKVWDKAVKVDSLIEYLIDDVEKYLSNEKPEKVIDVIYNGHDKKNPKEHIFPKSIIEDIGHTHIIIDLAKDLLDEISKKFVDYQEFIEYHLKEKENIEERKTLKKAV